MVGCCFGNLSFGFVSQASVCIFFLTLCALAIFTSLDLGEVYILKVFGLH